MALKTSPDSLDLGQLGHGPLSRLDSIILTTGIDSIVEGISSIMEDEPETVVLSGTPSVETSDTGEFNPYAGASAGAGAYQQPMMIQQTNDNATYSMWLGIATWICHITSGVVCFTLCLAPFTTIAGIVLGHMGYNISKEMNLGRNEAIAGLVLNYLSLAMYAAIVLGGAALLGGVGAGLI